MSEQGAIRVIKMFAYMFPIDRQPALTIAMEALEKQVAKKPIYSRLYATTPNMNCSVCGKTFISEYPKPKYCSVCGQKIDWSDEE